MSRKRKKKKNRSVLCGTLRKNKKGFGFVDAGDGEDIYIARDCMEGAMDGDVVEIDLLPEYMWELKREAIVTAVKERAVSEVCGIFRKRRNGGYVASPGFSSDDTVMIKKEDAAGARDGDAVTAKITKYPDRKNDAQGKVIQIISRKGVPGADIDLVVRKYQVPQCFPEKVLSEAVCVSRESAGSLADPGRRDLRSRMTFTIDGPDAKDFDDAVSCERSGNGNYILGVHIADVSHYVREDSFLDKEAEKRGTSIYLPDRVIPMLPAELSNGICSLNPGEDRLTLTCEMEISKDGEIIRYEIYESIIRSKERLIYEDVSLLLDNEPGRMERRLERTKRRYSHILNELELMKECCAALERKRKRRGSIDFDVREAQIVLDEKGVCTDVRTEDRGSANRMIEEFMIAANQTVAEHFCGMQIPFVYRVHDRPELIKMTELFRFLKNFGIETESGPGEVSPSDLAKISDKIKGRPYEAAVSSIMLRTMQKAMYSVECRGHFGLALKYYCHFTSPIRRYPDLMIHRIIKEYIHGGIDDRRRRFLLLRAGKASESSSASERRAVELEREVSDMKKAEYMDGCRGEKYDGIISQVTHFGIFVQLENTVEGLVRYEDIGDDYYDYDEMLYCAIGRSSKRRLSIGDKVRVKNAGRHFPDENEIIFTLL